MSMYINMKVKVKSLSRARLFATPWIVACTKLLRPWDFQGKSTGVGCHFLLQYINICITKSFWLQQKLTQCIKSTIVQLKRKKNRHLVFSFSLSLPAVWGYGEGCLQAMKAAVTRHQACWNLNHGFQARKKIHFCRLSHPAPGAEQDSYWGERHSQSGQSI